MFICIFFWAAVFATHVACYHLLLIAVCYRILVYSKTWFTKLTGAHAYCIVLFVLKVLKPHFAQLGFPIKLTCTSTASLPSSSVDDASHE